MTPKRPAGGGSGPAPMGPEAIGDGALRAEIQRLLAFADALGDAANAGKDLSPEQLTRAQDANMATYRRMCDELGRATLTQMREQAKVWREMLEMAERRDAQRAGADGAAEETPDAGPSSTSATSTGAGDGDAAGRLSASFERLRDEIQSAQNAQMTRILDEIRGNFDRAGAPEGGRGEDGAPSKSST